MTTTDRFQALEARQLFAATIQSFGADKSQADIGEPVTLHVDATSAAGLAAASFFVDMNNNGGWDPGIDLGLGDTWALGSPTTATFTKVVAPTSQWPVPARIFTNVLDRDRDWITRPQGISISRRAGIPGGLFVNAGAHYVSPGDVFDVTVTGSSAIPLVAGSFFIDVDRDGQYTRGADLPLGDVWTPLAGTSTYRLRVTAAWDWNTTAEDPSHLGDQSVLIRGNVVDVNGQWGQAAATLIQLAPHPNVSAFTAIDSGTSVQLNAKVENWATSGYAVVLPGAPNSVLSVSFFYDANRNGRFDGGDSLLGVNSFNQANFSLGGTATINAAANPAWAYPRYYGAFATDARPEGINRTAAKTAVALGNSSNIANLRPWVSSVRQVRGVTPRPGPLVTAGDLFDLEAAVSPAIGSSVGLQSAIAFIDNDRNGQYNSLADTFLEELPVSPVGQVAHFRFPMAGAGQVEVAVAAKDLAGRIGESRATVVLVAKRPAIENVSSSLVTIGGTRFLQVFIDVNDSPLTVREIDGTIDPRSVSVFVPYSGTASRGRWMLRINVSGMASGHRNLALRVSNFYRADTQLNVDVVI